MEDAAFSGFMIRTFSDKPPTLEEAQQLLGGLVEMVQTDIPDTQIMVNEEGWMHGLEPNPEASLLAKQPLLGPAIILKGKAKWD